MRVSTFLFYQTNTVNITTKQWDVNESILHLSSGKRVINASDDAVAANSILNFKQSITTTEQYQRNVDFANNRISAEETSLKATEDILLRIKDLTLQGNNGAYTQENRIAIAEELEARFDELLALANTRDEGGNYVFAGYQTENQPFNKQPDGTVIYQGDDGQRLTSVGDGVKVATSDSGQQIFQQAPNSTGDFRPEYRDATGLVTNTGGVTVKNASVVDRGVYDTTAFPPPYTVNFVDSDGDGEPEIEVLDSTLPVPNPVPVFDSTGTQVYPPPPAPAPAPAFVPGEKYTFNGVEMQIDGEPNVGDSLTLNADEEVGMFETLRDVIEWLKVPNEDGINPDDISKQQRQIDIGHLIDDIDSIAIHVSSRRGTIGARLNTVTTQENVNAEYILTLETAKSPLEDLDYTTAITEFERQKVALQAAQTAFTQVQNLSLFNLI
ncbi:flagellar hook-associated protein FlgL [Corallincola spongiicola]|uniref:Flagellar hook-associated protein 3 n=1 Tax=Corallincola spongiicola TaxID=2520508 RepID=A0ABY1WKW4_9GAMM|nr:flagellar hook-associated protein FlgL [Corallincola spongiicola]TAA40332.1 flagellar hook-associated protein 3 [Corallincola spongiicola]